MQLLCGETYGGYVSALKNFLIGKLTRFKLCGGNNKVANFAKISP